jgi:hypothetical protein
VCAPGCAVPLMITNAAGGRCYTGQTSEMDQAYACLPQCLAWK